MKNYLKLNWLQLFLALLCIGICPGCLGFEDEPKDWSEVVNLYVSSETGDYRSFEYPAELPPLEGMKIRENINSEWTVIHINGIEGFVYEKGFEYYLKVEKIHIANPPMDASDIKYKLIEVISKK